MHFKNMAYLLLFTTGMASANEWVKSFEGEPHLNFTVYGFAADVDGSIGQGRIHYDVDQPFSETLKHLDRVFMAYLELSKGRWGAYLDHQYVKTSESKDPFNIALAITTKLEQTSYGLYYQAYKSEHMTLLNRHQWIIEPTIGVHHTLAHAQLGALGRKLKGKVSWNEFFGGVRGRYNFDSPWNLAGEITVGDEDTFSAHAYLGYNLEVFERLVNLRVGYRYFKQNYKSDDFHWDVRQRGPVIGLNLPIF